MPAIQSLVKETAPAIVFGKLVVHMFGFLLCLTCGLGMFLVAKKVHDEKPPENHHWLINGWVFVVVKVGS